MQEMQDLVDGGLIVRMNSTLESKWKCWVANPNYAPQREVYREVYDLQAAREFFASAESEL